MPLVTVLSPHRDDAVFSLYLSILHWSECGVTVRVVNFFTRSNYGPRLGTGEHAFVTESRCREDRYALATVPSGRVVETSCHFADAPLRPPIIFNSVCRPETAALLTSDFIDDLSIVIKNYLSKGLVLAPLAIGDHVDHVAIRDVRPAKGGLCRECLWNSLNHLHNQETGRRASKTESSGTLPFTDQSGGGTNHCTACL